MAKKAKTSARSKGYRKTVKQEPFLSKKEIFALVAVVVLIALAIILFNLLYDDGSLDVVDGVVQAENIDNSIITMGTVNDQAKYFKVAEVGNIDGYTRERIEGSSDANLSAFEFIPEDEAAPIDTIYMTGSFGTPDSTIDNDMLYYSMSGITVDAPATLEVDGRSVEYFVSTVEIPAEEEAEDTAQASDGTDGTGATGPEATEEASETVAPTEGPVETTEPTVEPAASAEPTDTTEPTTAPEGSDVEAEGGEAGFEPGKYSCWQTLIAYAPSALNDDFSVSIRIQLSGETETVVDEEGLAAYTDGLYLSTEELLSYLEQALQAIYATDAE